MLAYRLEALPSMSLWQRKSEADSRKLGLAPKVGDSIHLNFEAPQVSWQLVGRPQGQLFDLAVPLSPGCLARIGKVEAGDLRAALPAPVRGRLRAPPDRAAMGEMAIPHAVGANTVDVERQGSGRDRFLERGDNARNPQVLAGGEQIEWLAVIERGDRLVHPNRDVLGVHHPQQSFADR